MKSLHLFTHGGRLLGYIKPEHNYEQTVSLFFEEQVLTPKQKIIMKKILLEEVR